jgi:transcriptional regulator with XRE-family HTH domain
LGGERAVAGHAELVFGQRLTAARQEKGWTLRALALRAGIHWTHLAKVERGERSVSLRNILRLAYALEIDPDRLAIGVGRGASTSPDRTR